MGDWGWIGGPQLPHEEASTSEHFKEVGEDVRGEREAERIAKAHPKRPRWKFWGKRTG